MVFTYWASAPAPAIAQPDCGSYQDTACFYPARVEAAQATRRARALRTLCQRAVADHLRKSG